MRSKRTIERRLNSSGLGEPILQVLGEDRLLVQIPGVSDPDSAKVLIGETAQLEFKHRTHNVPRPLEFEDGEIVAYRVVEVTPELFAPPEAEEADSGDTEASVSEDSESTEEAATEASDSADTETSDDTAEDDTEEVAAVPAEPGPPGLVLEFNDTGFANFTETINEMRDSLIPAKGAQNLFPDRLAFSLAGADAQEVEVVYQQAILLEDGQVVPLGDPYIREIIGSNKYVISLGEIETIFESSDPLAEAEQQFSAGGKLVFKLIKGKVDEDINLTGDDLARAYAGQHQTSNAPIVNIEFNGEGTRKFAEITTQIAGTNDQIAIFLDDEELIAPVAEQAITGGTAYISGQGFTISRVRDICASVGGWTPADSDNSDIGKGRRRDSRLRLAGKKRARGRGRSHPRLPVHALVLPNAGADRGTRAADLRPDAHRNIQDAAGHAHALRRRRRHPFRGYGSGREHPHIRENEGGDARRTNAPLLDQYRIQPRVVCHSGQQRLDADNLGHSVLVRRHAGRDGGAGLRRNPCHRGDAQHVLGHLREQDALAHRCADRNRSEAAVVRSD